MRSASPWRSLSGCRVETRLDAWSYHSPLCASARLQVCGDGAGLPVFEVTRHGRHVRRLAMGARAEKGQLANHVRGVLAGQPRDVRQVHARTAFGYQQPYEIQPCVAGANGRRFNYITDGWNITSDKATAWVAPSPNKAGAYFWFWPSSLSLLVAGSGP